MERQRLVLNDEACGELLDLARMTLRSYLGTGEVPAYEVRDPALLAPAAAFVSLHQGAELRGCIGLLSGDVDLYRTVQRCVISAALEDARFRPVTMAELPGLTIEISVLGAPKPIQDMNLIEVGRHGLIVTLGGARGLLLPQVATQYGWDREMFLAQTCRKAGLSAQAWRQPKAVIQIFDAQVFSDERR